jgi:hypothetical protein
MTLECNKPAEQRSLVGLVDPQFVFVGRSGSDLYFVNRTSPFAMDVEALRKAMDQQAPRQRFLS